MKAPRTVTRPAGVCPILWFNKIVGGRYKLWIIYELKDGPVRYGALRRGLVDATMEKAVTARTLSRELKDLALLGLIKRKEYPGVPPKVEYTLTSDGKRIIPVIQGMMLWVFGKPVPDVPFPFERPKPPLARTSGSKIAARAA